MEFKDVLRKEGIRSKMTQEELGAKVGLKKSAIHKYENGLIVNPGRTLIFKLAQALNVSPCYLLTGEYGSAKQEQSLNGAESKLLDMFRKLNSTGQEKAMDYVRDLSEQTKYTDPPSPKTKEAPASSA